MKRIAVFDFCETIVNFQTATPFVDFVFKQSPNKLGRFIDFLIIPLKKRKLIPTFLHKRLQVLKLRGVSNKDLEELSEIFVEKYILPKENKKVTEKIEWHKKQGDSVVIVSGGFTPYIKKYAELKKIDKVIATDLASKHNKLTGFIKGENCMGENKVRKLKKQFDLSEFDLNDSYAYSDDTKNDKYIFNLVKTKFLVKKDSIKKI